MTCQDYSIDIWRNLYYSVGMPNKGKRAGRKNTYQKSKAALYRSSNKQMENKIKKVKRHLKKHPTDKTALIIVN